MNEILCSTGAIIGKSNGRNYRLMEELSRKLLCDGFEFMMYKVWYDEIDEITRMLQAIGLDIPVIHCEKNIGSRLTTNEGEELSDTYRLFEKTCQMADALKTKKLVLHLWDGIVSDSNFSKNLNEFAHLLDIAKQYKLDLLVENVVCNHENPMKHWCELKVAYPDVHFCFDTKMAAFHSQLDLLYEKEYEWLWRDKHICHYHVNDYNGGHMDWAKLRTLPIGQGKVDFERFFEYIRTIGYEGTFTVEASAVRADGTVDIDILNRQFDYMRGKLL